MNKRKKSSKLLAMLLAMTLCMSLLPQGVYAAEETPAVVVGTPETASETELNSEYDDLKTAAQDAIDALPDTTAEDFAVSAENLADYKALLTTASDAIAAFMTAGGTEEELDFTKYDALSAAIGAFDGGVAPTDGLMTFRDYIIKILKEKGTTVADGISDDDLNALIRANQAYFSNVDIPTDTVSDLDYLPTLFKAIGDYFSCVVTTPPEFSYEAIHSLFPAGSNAGRNKKIYIGAPNHNVEEPYFETIGIDFVPAPNSYIFDTDPLLFVDAIPETFYLPVLFVFHETHPGYNPCVGLEGVDDPEEGSGVTVTRDETSIKVDLIPGFDLNLIADQDNPLTIHTTYSMKLYSEIGADGVSLSKNGCSPLVSTPIKVKYSVSVEPITAGAMNGQPGIAGLDADPVTPTYPKYSLYPDEPEPGRALANSDININRGMNRPSDSVGSNTGGADIRGLENPEGTFSAGLSSHMDTIAEDKIHTGTMNGVRTTGFTDYGSKNIEVSGNPDIAGGFEVDYYEVQVFDPVTCESMGWLQSDGTVNSMQPKAKLSEDQVNGYLRGVGISGKTKIYVAYKTKASFTKTDKNGNPLTRDNIGLQNLPSFVLYNDENCTQYAIDSDMDGIATEDESTCDYYQTTGQVEFRNIPAMLEGVGTFKTYYMKETAPGFAEDGMVYPLTIDKDGQITFPIAAIISGLTGNTPGGFQPRPDGTYILPNTPLNVNLKLQAAKTLDGNTDELVDDQFKFVLKQTGTPTGVGNLLPAEGVEAYNKADGSVLFDEQLAFETPGTYTFTAKEDTTYRKEGADYSKFHFDDTERTIKVVVRWADTDSGDAETERGLKAIISVKMGDEEETVVGTVTGMATNTVVNTVATPNPNTFATGIVFQNTSDPKPAEATLNVTKTLDDKAPQSGKFSFTLKRTQAPAGAASFTALTKQNTAGTVDFGKLTLDKAGTYVFQVSEVKGSDSNIVYDERVYTVTMTVETDRSNALKVTAQTYSYKKDGATVTATSAAFANTTKPTPTPTSSTKPNPTPTSSTKPNPTPTSSTKPNPTPTSSTKPNPTPTSSTKPNPTPTSSTKPNPTPTSSTKPTPTPTSSHSSKHTPEPENTPAPTPYTGTTPPTPPAPNPYGWSGSPKTGDGSALGQNAALALASLLLLGVLVVKKRKNKHSAD